MKTAIYWVRNKERSL